MTAHVSPDAPRPPTRNQPRGVTMPFDEAAFTRKATELVAQGDRVPVQRDDAPYGWFDPEWVRVETVMWADDGTVTRSAGWVRREEWFASLGSDRMTG